MVQCNHGIISKCVCVPKASCCIQYVPLFMLSGVCLPLSCPPAPPFSFYPFPRPGGSPHFNWVLLGFLLKGSFSLSMSLALGVQAIGSVKCLETMFIAQYKQNKTQTYFAGKDMVKCVSDHQFCVTQNTGVITCNIFVPITHKRRSTHRFL